MYRNVPVAPMRRCVITCCLGKSDRIGLETCYLFNCAAVSSSDIFGTAASIMLYWSIASKLFREIFFRAQKQLFRKFPMITKRRSEKHCTSLCHCDLICPDSKLWHIGALEQLPQIYALRYDLSY